MEHILADSWSLLAFGALFLIVMALGERLRRAVPGEPEWSRKFVHVCGGVGALFFPWAFSSPWSVLLLAGIMALVLLVSLRSGTLTSVHGVPRKSLGALYFPVAILLLFIIGRQQPPFYVISVLTLTVADSVAALVGLHYGAIRFDVEGNPKSLEGSVTFFFVTYLCVQIPLLLMTATGRAETVLIAFIIALLVTGFEAVSPAGSDNILVPLGTWFILTRMSHQSVPELLTNALALLILALLTAILSGRQRVFATSGLIGMVLVNYAAWSLCGFWWLLPLLLSQTMIAVMIALFRHRTPVGIAGYQIRVLFYAALVPVLLLFAANLGHRQEWLYLPYLTAIAAQMGAIFAFLLSILTTTTGPVERLRESRVASTLLCSLTATLFIAAIPLLAGRVAMSLAAALLVLGGSLLTVIFCRSLAGLFLADAADWLGRQRLRCVASGVAALLALLVQELWGMI
jgi:phytol kinase